MNGWVDGQTDIEQQTCRGTVTRTDGKSVRILSNTFKQSFVFVSGYTYKKMDGMTFRRLTYGRTDKPQLVN